ncbi:hypothetical protein [uncultured Chryseobacterium sp.]|uniref:hypothetical protein n=1 Tax=uncultured Chryseobacterium sp. TaxID=259322 RepID=UPI0025F68CF2|nr:hypothetical protein [uncultured Chryseobacterium sp.]
MKNKIFKYRSVYCLAIITSLLLFLTSSFNILQLFQDFSLLKLVLVCCSIIFSSFAFINLVEKYDKAVLFLNLSLVFYMILTGFYLLIEFLNIGTRAFANIYFKLLIAQTLILIIVNLYRIKQSKETDEIENIGQTGE